MDDVVLIVNSAREVNEMLQVLNTRSKEVDLKINESKTKVMLSSHMLKAKLRVDGADLKEVDSYVYFV